MKRFFIFCLSAAFCLFTKAFAEKITFSAESMSGTAGSDTGTTTLSGNACIITETMEIQADEIELSGKDYRFINARGNVTGRNTQSELDFTCNAMNYDRQTKVAILENGVHLVDAKNEVTANAENIQYDQNTDVAIMSVQVDIVQKENHCTAAYAIYRKKEQTLDLSGNPKITQGEDTFRAQAIVLNMETNQITLDGRVKGSVTSKKDDDAKKDSSKDSAASSSKDAGAKDDSSKSTENKNALDGADESKKDLQEKNQGEADVQKDAKQ